VSRTACWSPFQIVGILLATQDLICIRNAFNRGGDDLSSVGIPGGQIDSLRAMVTVITQGFRFGGTDLGDTRGTYFDNIRVGFVRTTAPTLAPCSNRACGAIGYFPCRPTLVPGSPGRRGHAVRSCRYRARRLRTS